MAKALKSPANRAASRPLARGHLNPAPTGRGLADARRVHPALPHVRARPERATRHAPLRTPTLAAFGRQWFEDLRVGWKPSNCESITCILEGIVYPMLGDRPVDSIRRSDLLAFRAEVMRTRPGRGGNKTIGNRRANRIMTVFQTVLREAALQLDFPDPCLQMRPLKEPRADIQPFSLDEIGRLVNAAPTLFKDYILVRCLTAMRSGEINGLPWENVDFDNRMIRVRAARVRGEQVLPKNEFGDRDIPMSQPVFDAMKRQFKRTGKLNTFVFLSARGKPINTNNFSNRDWPEILTKANLKLRRPYQTRHTGATLMLASGENPEWIAHVLGHADCEMLWRVYSRYVPNMTRKDGSALDAVVRKRFRQVSQ
jgi:integrase